MNILDTQSLEDAAMHLLQMRVSRTSEERCKYKDSVAEAHDHRTVVNICRVFLMYISYRRHEIMQRSALRKAMVAFIVNDDASQTSSQSDDTSCHAYRRLL